VTLGRQIVKKWKEGRVFASYFMSFSLDSLYGIKWLMNDGKSLEGNSCCLMKVLSSLLSGGTQGNHEETQS
jgi:hypothetical protein